MADRFLASILYRVTVGSRFYTAKELIEDIRRNIELILNSRLMIPSEYLLRPTSPAASRYLNNSLVNFGIADIQSLNLGDDLMEARFCESVRIGIERFEPRVANVAIEMTPSLRDRVINISVKGSLVVAPFEDIRFQSGIEPEMQKFVVS